MSKGTNEKRRQRRQAQRQQKRTSIPEREAHVEQVNANGDVCPKCGGPMHKKTVAVAHFSIQQDYKITCDESPIDDDEHWVIVTVSGKDNEEATSKYNIERKARSHRMYHAILGNQEALVAVLEYKTIQEHDYLSEGDNGFVEGNYGEDIGFYDILVKIAHIFTEEDREEVLNLPDDSNTKLLHFEDLGDCFKVVSDGWCLHTHTH